MKLRNLFGKIKKSTFVDVEKYIDSHFEVLIHESPEPFTEGKFSRAIKPDVDESVSDFEVLIHESPEPFEEGKFSMAMELDIDESVPENAKYSTEPPDSGNAAPAIKESSDSEIRYSLKGPADSGIRYSLKIPSGLRLILENADESFAESLIRTIDYVGMKDSDVYNKADISRQLFNNIKNNPNYHPSKQTVLSLICAMELKYTDSVELLKRAGYAFSKSSKFDLIVEYCIRNRIYKIADINDILYHFDQPLLGSSKM